MTLLRRLDLTRIARDGRDGRDLTVEEIVRSRSSADLVEAHSKLFASRDTGAEMCVNAVMGDLAGHSETSTRQSPVKMDNFLQRQRLRLFLGSPNHRMLSHLLTKDGLHAWRTSERNGESWQKYRTRP